MGVRMGIIALCLAGLWSCTNPGRDGLTPASNLSNAEVQVVQLTSNVTADGYCIVRVYFENRDFGLPILSRLNGTVLEPVDGVVIATEPNQTHSDDFITSIEAGLLIFIGQPSNRHDVSFVDIEEGGISPVTEVDLRFDAHQIFEQSGRPVSWKDFHFIGAQSVITLRSVRADWSTLLNAIDGEGLRTLKIDAYPYGGWLLSQDGADCLLLAIERPRMGPTYELMRLNDAEGNRLDVLELELVTLSPEFWQMSNPAAGAD